MCWNGVRHIAANQEEKNWKVYEKIDLLCMCACALVSLVIYFWIWKLIMTDRYTVCECARFRRWSHTYIYTIFADMRLISKFINFTHTHARRHSRALSDRVSSHSTLCIFLMIKRIALKNENNQILKHFA